MPKCAKCAEPTKGYKCDICGVESRTHDPNHEHGSSHCLPKCKACDEAETKCTCA